MQFQCFTKSVTNNYRPAQNAMQSTHNSTCEAATTTTKQDAQRNKIVFRSVEIPIGGVSADCFNIKLVETGFQPNFKSRKENTEKL